MARPIPCVDAVTMATFPSRRRHLTSIAANHSRWAGGSLLPFFVAAAAAGVLSIPKLGAPRRRVKGLPLPRGLSRAIALKKVVGIHFACFASMYQLIQWTNQAVVEVFVEQSPKFDRYKHQRGILRMLGSINYMHSCIGYPYYYSTISDKGE
jgi:hypothetical protein